MKSVIGHKQHRKRQSANIKESVSTYVMLCEGAEEPRSKQKQKVSRHLALQQEGKEGHQLLLKSENAKCWSRVAVNSIPV